MTYPIRNQDTQPRTQYPPSAGDDFDYGMDDPYGDMENGYPTTEDRFEGPGGESSSEPVSARDLRLRIDQLRFKLPELDLRKKDIEKLSKQLDQLLEKINLAQGGKPADRDAKLAAAASQLSAIEPGILDIPGEDDLSGGWGDEEEGTQEVKKEKIDFLLEALKNGEIQPEEDSKLKKEDCIALLQEALQDQAAGKPKAAAAGYAEVVEALGGEKDAKEIAAENYGETPKKIEKNTLYFEGGEDGSLSFKSAGHGKNIVVENAESVDITPKNKTDAVTVTEEGGYYVIKTGNDTFKVKNDVKIHIQSDKVSGDVENGDGDITVGASGKTTRKYFSPEKMQALADSLTAAANGMQTATETEGEDGDYGAHIPPKSKYGVDDASWVGQSVVTDAKKVLTAVADALRETDPVKQKEAMEYATEVLSRVRTETSETGYTNNKAQAIFNVLHGELGENGLKQALETGLISQEFADELAKGLEARVDENNDTNGEVKYHVGGPGWTHSTSAEFLKRHSRKATIQD